MDEKQKVNKQNRLVFIESFFKSFFLYAFIAALCGSYCYTIEQGFVFNGAGIGPSFSCIFITLMASVLLRMFLFKKRFTVISVALDLLILAVGVFLLVSSFGRDGQSYPATDGVLAKLVATEVRPGSTGYEPSYIWYALCACSTIALCFRYENRNSLAFVFLGSLLAIIVFLAISTPIENNLFNSYINSGHQSVLRDNSVVVSHIIAIVSCIGIMLTHTVSSILTIRKEE